jgi:hypothetical protein
LRSHVSGMSSPIPPQAEQLGGSYARGRDQRRSRRRQRRSVPRRGRRGAMGSPRLLSARGGGAHLPRSPPTDRSTRDDDRRHRRQLDRADPSAGMRARRGVS